MLRVLNLVILGALLIVLLGMAFANREMVMVEAMPATLAAWIGVDWSVRMPLFLVILMSVLLGLVIGLVWEWLREYGQRAEAARTQAELQRTRQQLAETRNTLPAEQKSRDDILALLNER
ncbi:lipopolysaccharide assembly protein LapA domain-containing protein [Paracoccus sp. p4-l81]|uniref:lipopolysaccharide assembly protein LapA domain-containing protein n=1 Tax=Paracoccus sp. p4-l81 TaxID=3342806 RepID=UPI0035BA6311